MTKKKTRITSLISDKIHFKLKLVKRDKEDHYIMITVSMHKNNITVIIFMYQILEHLNI